MKIYLSKQGIKDIKKKVSKLEHEKRMLELKLKQDEVKEDFLSQSEIFSRIESIRSEIEEKQFALRNAKILPKRSKKNSLKANIGSFVELLDKATGKIMKFQIVDSLEANPLIGKISVESPLGKNLLGRTVNEMISWTTGKQHMNMTLVAVR